MQIKTSGKQKVVKMSKTEWLAIGEQTGWSKKYAFLDGDNADLSGINNNKVDEAKQNFINEILNCGPDCNVPSMIKEILDAWNNVRIDKMINDDNNNDLKL